MATVSGLTTAASLQTVVVTTGAETRPSTAAKVLWIGGSTKPDEMAEGDIWLRELEVGPTLPEFITTSLNTLTQDVAFSQSLILNGTFPFTFSIATGSLPDGLNLNTSSGVISGTPTTSGPYSFTILATNSVGSTGQDFFGSVSATPVAPDILTETLSSLTQGTPFNQTISAIGTSPLTWTVSSGTLPSGLVLNSSTGVLSGTPTGSGAYSFVLQATNVAGSDTQMFSGTIEATGTAPTITTTDLTTMRVGSSFTQTLNKTGSSPITWGISAGTIPSGLTISSSTGTISGTPTAEGAYSFTVSATNSFGSDTQEYTGSVSPALAEDIYSIFNSATWPLTSHSDGAPGSWVSQQYYCSSLESALPVNSKIIGGRLYVPPGSAHIGQIWYAGLIRNLTGIHPGVGSFNSSDYESNGSKKTGSALIAGWNEILFDTEYDMVGPGESWMIGVSIGDGSRYLYDTTYDSSPVKNPEGNNFYLAEVEAAGIVRCWYNSTESPAAFYGIDTLVRIPE